ncbi:MerR family transcriptional regulator [Solicola sp. PLA-1-18]|uniref:MerR family transcriptional regulator n=1 Tax=Solicola sp. PLA-1-18 TaxID=3380532 RepID=UPI003B77B75B
MDDALAQTRQLDPVTDDATTTARTDARPAPGETDLLWGVGAVATRLNLPPATLRTWERRYGVGPSERTQGGHRRYSEEDILRAQVVAHLISRGVPAQAGARVALSLDQTGLVAALADGGTATSPRGVDPDMQPEVAIQSIIAAAHQGGPDELGHLYARVLGQWGIVPGWDSVLAPALSRIGDLWFDGLMGIEGEHLATERLSAELRAYTRRKRPQTSQIDPIVIASADDEMHSLPLIALEAALAADGLTCYALGSRVPARALAHTLERKQPRVVFLWSSIARPQVDETWSAFDRLDHEVTVLLGGPGWPAERAASAPDTTMLHSLGGAVDAVRDAFADPS